jgi:hypothetical protein
VKIRLICPIRVPILPKRKLLKVTGLSLQLIDGQSLANFKFLILNF